MTWLGRSCWKSRSRNDKGKLGIPNVSKRIAFVVSASPSNKLSAGLADASHIYSRMVDQSLGCCDNSSCLLAGCKNAEIFLKHLTDLLHSWASEDQLIFYFSGHGQDFNDVYSLQFGNSDRDW